MTDAGGTGTGERTVPLLAAATRGRSPRHPASPPPDPAGAEPDALGAQRSRAAPASLGALGTARAHRAPQGEGVLGLTNSQTLPPRDSPLPVLLAEAAPRPIGSFSPFQARARWWWGWGGGAPGSTGDRRARTAACTLTRRRPLPRREHGAVQGVLCSGCSVGLGRRPWNLCHPAAAAGSLWFCVAGPSVRALEREEHS